MTPTANHRDRISPMFEPLEGRQLMSAVPVALRVLGASGATEGAGESVRLMVSRAKALPVSTRVFFSIDGTAQPPPGPPSPSFDYILDGMIVPDPSQTQNTPVEIAGKTFVVIPAGQTSTTFTWTPADDSKAEGIETATFTIQPDAAYRVSDPSTATLSIFDNDFRINFQPAGTATPPGYISDTGLAFGQRGRGVSYGWVTDISAKAATRNNKQSPDARYDSLIGMQQGGNHKWEIALPNGTYMVRLVAGDPDNTNSNYGIRIEDGLGVGGRPNGNLRFFRVTEVVQVRDGRLTLSNVLGSFNNKINFIDIKSVPLRTRLGRVAMVSAALKTSETADLWHQQPDGLFADNQIDEPLWADFGSSSSGTQNPTSTGPVKPSSASPVISRRVFSLLRI